MSELNHDILEKNISQLLKRKGITQNQLAEIARMTQANVSKALNPKEKKHFTIDQIYRISRCFKVSIDSLVGDSEEIKASPRSCFEFLSYLMKIGRLRTATIEYEETVYEKSEIWARFKDAKRTIATPAFYFPDFYTPTTDKDNAYAENIYFEKKSNKTDYYQLNRVLEKTSPIIRLFFSKNVKRRICAGRFFRFLCILLRLQILTYRRVHCIIEIRDYYSIGVFFTWLHLN